MTVLLARVRLGLLRRDRSARRRVVQLAQAGEHLNLQADHGARPVHRGEGLQDRSTHQIVGTLTIAREQQCESAQMSNAFDDLRSPRRAGLKSCPRPHPRLHKSVASTVVSSGGRCRAAGFDGLVFTGR